MDRSPTQRDIETLRVAFSNGNKALIVMPQANIPTDIIAHALELPLPGAVILIAGGAAKMDGDASDLSSLLDQKIDRSLPQIGAGLASNVPARKSRPG